MERREGGQRNKEEDKGKDTTKGRKGEKEEARGGWRGGGAWSLQGTERKSAGGGGLGEGERAGGREEGERTLSILHLDQGMTDSILADHLSGPLFDDKAHPPSAIHYPLSLPEARASIMLPLRDDARPGTERGLPVAGGVLAHHYGRPIPHPTCRAADCPPLPSHSQALCGGPDTSPADSQTVGG